MPKILALRIQNAAFLFLFILTNCNPFQQRKDEHIKLTNQQKSFIESLHAGDTVAWSSSFGYKDSAIISPVQYDEYIVDFNKDGDTFLERGYYKHQFIGTKKSAYVPDGVGVIALWSSKGGVANLWDNGFSSPYRNVFTSHSISNKKYWNVYWGTSNSSDSSFVNSLGYLGYKISGEVYTKIK